MKKNKGFTLIELLVVIAIIGILSAVVLASLNSARNKGGNAAVKSNLQGMRSQAEIVYDDNNQDYTNVCSSQNILDALTAAMIAGGDLGAIGDRCSSNSTEWAVNAQLKVPEGANTFWCTDFTGQNQGIPAELVAGDTSCL
jgi:prepilin-type N-terminal cleavage/methylation domain-containing protein